MKKLQAALLTIGLLMMMIPLSSTAAQPKEIAVVIDGEAQLFDVPPVKINGRVFVPMRAIFESLGAHVSWNADKGEVTATSGSTVVVLTVGSETALIDGKTHKLDAVPQQIKGRTMVPLRFVGEALGANVDWDGANQSVAIKSQPAAAAVTPEQLAEDEANIRAVIEANTMYYNEADAEGYLSTLAEPAETVEQMKAYFRSYNYVHYDLVDISDIQIAGGEATIRIVRITTTFENRNTPEQYVSARLQSEFEIKLVKQGSEWKILNFKRVKFEQLPIES